MSAVVRRALLLHVFYGVGRAGLGARAAQVQRVWDDCGRLGLDAAVPGEALLDEVPGIDGPAPRYRVLAARQRTGGGLRQALLFQSHDVVGVTLLLAPEHESDGQSLERLVPWACPGSLGSVQVLLGLSAGALFTADGGGGVVPEVAGEVAVLFPGSRPGEPHRTRQGFALWEAPGGGTPGARRRLVALAPVALERELDAFAWHARDRPAPLTRYALHAAKLRYERAVLDRSRHGELRDRAGEAVRRASEVTARLLGGDGPALREVLDARGELVALRTDAQGLIVAASRLRMMRRTVEIALDNLMASVPGECDPPPDATLPSASPFAGDRLLGERLRQDVDDELEYLQAAVEASAEVSREALAAAEVHLADHRQSLTLLQTSFIGALLMGLAAVQAFSYRVPMPGPVQAPVIALLAALALTLPVTVLAWSRGTVRTGSFAVLHPVLLGAVGASVGWLAATLVARGTDGGAQQDRWSLVGAGAGAVAAAAADVLGRRWRTRTRT
ncbi:CATRA conflict system CASPASE/TPR repeat-associated protein [Streptomyces sp. NRRL B-1347]|uniref:CATRA conflict system CASPASE/TPR repeat-associated protein n=1 Tax=Streptomyces sp. NRRL B-1347 TaxID=1476877 RepID=UPI000560121C|nr:CATRA conflict system CASPASE/TPR repeat-associated protein [Streptomyces sp. NRRL B-1347]